MQRFRNASTFVVSLLFIVLLTGMATAQVEPSSQAKRYVSGGFGIVDYEGDQPVDDASSLMIHLGYDFNEWWTIDGAFSIIPTLNENTYGNTPTNTGVWREVHPLEETIGKDSTWAVGAAVDGLFHFTRWERLDPYLAIGIGFIYYGDDFGDGHFDPQVRAGGGVMYHFNDEWALRCDARALITAENTEANSIIEGGVVWYWDAHVPFDPLAGGGPLDSDADGLLDSEEDALGTNKHNPDTDEDGLKDGAEVNRHKTLPLNPDTDADGLIDGLEVYKYKTDPLLRDTDDGGVSDGHEVAEDGTDPNNGADDLLLFELYIQFRKDKSDIKPQYFSQLNVIAKVLKRHSGSTASIEGHADRTKRSVAKYNKDLSNRRAKAVLKYLSNKQGIAKSRLSAVGYGFERPKVQPVDLINGNPENRRVDVFIRGAGKKQDLIDSGLVDEDDFIVVSDGDMMPEDK
jgi:outer membrane protein OmpA-like peptidoglycan-associated protein